MQCNVFINSTSHTAKSTAQSNLNMYTKYYNIQRMIIIFTTLVESQTFFYWIKTVLYRQRFDSSRISGERHYKILCASNYGFDGFCQAMVGYSYFLCLVLQW